MQSKLTRRDFLKDVVAVGTSLPFPGVVNQVGKLSSSSDREFLEVRNGKFYMGGEEYKMKGANYLSKDNPWRMLKNWNPAKVDKELELAKSLGINAVRTPITYIYSIGWDELFTSSGQYEGSPRKANVDEGYFENFNDFLDIAENHGIKIIPMLFDQSIWELFEPDFFDVGKKYLKQWLPEFSNDERIISWDVRNEPDVYPFFPEDSTHKVVDFVEEMTKFVKELDKNHPTTIGWMRPKNSKYDSETDFTSFHHYDWPRKLKKGVQKVRKHSDKALVLSEFGLTTLEESKTNPKYYGNQQAQKQYYNKILAKSEYLDLDGVYFWRLLDNPKELTEKNIDMGPVYNNPGFKDFELHMGVLKTDYSKKPAGWIVQNYYKWRL